MNISWEGTRPLPHAALLFLDCSSLFLHSLPSLISNYLNLLFGTKGGSRKLNEAYFLQTRNEDTERISIRQGPTGSCSISQMPSKTYWKIPIRVAMLYPPPDCTSRFWDTKRKHKGHDINLVFEYNTQSPRTHWHPSKCLNHWEFKHHLWF